MHTLRALSVFCVLLFTALPGRAAEPVFDTDHAISVAGENATPWRWRVNASRPGMLMVFDTAGKKPVARYDISDCMFCAGEEDNCHRDGIFGVTGDALTEPTLAVVCHVGAHSQRMELFQPQKNASEPVRSFTGAYYIDYRAKHNGLMIEYDIYVDGGTFKKVTVHWP